MVDAGNQGIPLFSLTAANASALLPQLSVSSAVKSQISAAVAAGQTVLVSQRAPERLDWSGVGYVMLDPDTGAGAYLIEGSLKWRRARRLRGTTTAAVDVHRANHSDAPDPRDDCSDHRRQRRLGRALLAALSAQLTDKQLAERAVGFAGVARFMENAAASGGVCARDIKSSLSFPRGAQIRVDIEVREGQAFTP
ncbi:hypothetical protein GCM10011487_22170 [Steroidobacter agaridevorans]|uniref:Uncharacterized protein n=1 Tax=Steroidobacter agaridevorans TaxID=2695856 RepID=A0A829YA79_9GAMM|nr:hypothetical protein [Steroidobacter agaridevorans]GFE80217.1 hypothetical protein GCM10011487_22170 [Steroidobacter agaridevorans]GFE89813.1 hypothetical protein GCM10011488_47670 [Steroidobacter agaridevorans]